MSRFVDIVEDISSLSIDEIEEVQRILNKLIIEKKRERIALNHKETEEQYKNGQLKFYDNASDLLNALNEE